jgi:hypothetical protein
LAVHRQPSTVDREPYFLFLPFQAGKQRKWEAVFRKRQNYGEWDKKTNCFKIMCLSVGVFELVFGWGWSRGLCPKRYHGRQNANSSSLPADKDEPEKRVV